MSKTMSGKINGDYADSSLTVKLGSVALARLSKLSVDDQKKIKAELELIANKLCRAFNKLGSLDNPEHVRALCLQICDSLQDNLLGLPI